MVKLNEPDTSFSQPSGQQTIGRETAVRSLCPVKVKNILGLI